MKKVINYLTIDSFELIYTFKLTYKMLVLRMFSIHFRLWLRQFSSKNAGIMICIKQKEVWRRLWLSKWFILISVIFLDFQGLSLTKNIKHNITLIELIDHDSNHLPQLHSNGYNKMYICYIIWTIPMGRYFRITQRR